MGCKKIILKNLNIFIFSKKSSSEFSSNLWDNHLKTRNLYCTVILDYFSSLLSQITSGYPLNMSSSNLIHTQDPTSFFLVFSTYKLCMFFFIFYCIQETVSPLLWPSTWSTWGKCFSFSVFFSHFLMSLFFFLWFFQSFSIFMSFVVHAAF